MVQIGISIAVGHDLIKRCLRSWFPSVPALTSDEFLEIPQPRPSILFAVAETGAADFPTLVDFFAFPGENSRAVAIGLVLARRFAAALSCRTICDGSGLGCSQAPFWSIIWENGRAFLADDSNSAFVDATGRDIRIIRELPLTPADFDDRARLV